MPQVTGVSMPVQTYEGAELIELLNKKQERTILGMFSWAKNLARTESGRSSEFLETMENLGLPKAHINEVRKLFGGSTSKGSDESNEIKMERRYANTTIVTSDLLRRAVAALRTGATLEDEQLVQMEKAAAIISRLAAQALQVASQKPVDKFCELFGVPNTEELHRLISDPSMMSVGKRAATQKALKELFELKRSMNEAMRSGKHLNLEPPLPVRAAAEEAEERNVLEHNALCLARSAGTCGQGSLAATPAARGSSRKEGKAVQRKDTANEEEKARGPTGADEKVVAGGPPRSRTRRDWRRTGRHCKRHLQRTQSSSHLLDAASRRILCGDARGAPATTSRTTHSGTSTGAARRRTTTPDRHRRW